MSATVGATAIDVDPRVARSRAKLLAAATELLVNDGIRAVTVDAVAERSGVAKSTLYRHWGSSRDLLLDVLGANVPEPEAVDLTAGFRPALHAWIERSAVALHEPDWPRTLVALLELGNHAPDVADLLRENFEVQLATLATILDLGAAEGRLRAGLDARQISYILLGPLVLAAVNGDSDSVGRLADEVLAGFLKSHAAPRVKR